MDLGLLMKSEAEVVGYVPWPEFTSWMNCEMVVVMDELVEQMDFVLVCVNEFER